MAHLSSTDRRAFTIIELMIALSILLALSAIVVPLSASWVRSALRAELPDQIEGALWTARALAGQHNTPVTLSAEASPSGVRLWAIYSIQSRSPDLSNDRSVPATRVPLTDLGMVRMSTAANGSNLTEPDSALASEPIRVAILLPDGTAIVAPSLRLTTSDLATKLVIDPFALTVASLSAPPEVPDTPEAPPP